jgi:adenylate kinase family enzyme
MRIVILGCAGSGKTTFARRVGRLTGLPVICLDEVWQPEWDEKNLSEFRQQVLKAHHGETWISDGNFAQATFDIRLPRATQIVWLERSKVFCFWNATKRVFRREEAHRMRNLEKVLSFIWKFDHVNRPRIEAERMAYGPQVPIVRLSSEREIKIFCERVAGCEPGEAVTGGRQSREL